MNNETTLLYTAATLFSKQKGVKTNPEAALGKNFGRRLAFCLTCLIFLLGAHSLFVPSVIDGRTNWLFVGLATVICTILFLFQWLNRATQEEKTIVIVWKPVRQKLIDHMVITEAQRVIGASPIGALAMGLSLRIQNTADTSRSDLSEVARQLGIKPTEVPDEAF